MTAAADLEFVQYKTLRSRIDFQNAAISNACSLLIEFKLYLCRICRIKQSNGELEKCCCVFPMPITIRSNPFQSIKLRSRTNKTKQCKHCHCKEAICFRTEKWNNRTEMCLHGTTHLLSDEAPGWAVAWAHDGTRESTYHHVKSVNSSSAKMSQTIWDGILPLAACYRRVGGRR